METITEIETYRKQSAEWMRLKHIKGRFAYYELPDGSQCAIEYWTPDQSHDQMVMIWDRLRKQEDNHQTYFIYESVLREYWLDDDNDLLTGTMKAWTEYYQAK